MMTIVIDQREATWLFKQFDFTVTLKAAAHTFEMGQSTLYCLIVYAQFDSHCNGRQRIQHIVLTW